MNWDAFRAGMLDVVQGACYGIGAASFAKMWMDPDNRKGAWVLTGVLAGLMLLFGLIGGFGVYIGTR